MAISLWDAETGGNPVGPIVDPGPAQITNGLFTREMDFGSVFDSEARWIQINVNGTTLSPRQPITAAPYALFSAGPWRLVGSSLVYESGNVGIGADNPGKTLQIGDSVFLGSEGMIRLGSRSST